VHRRRGFASLLMAVMAIAGATAMPTRTVESTRLIASIVRLDEAPRETEIRRVSRAIGRPTRRSSASHVLADATRALASQFPLDRFQRPPPQTAT